ncbi:MAG TPA: D-alanyl-D-alanine carboxypeptidase family protein [Acidimicrobiia bacterium]|nr:D-alanyl-D-alanine carboxypeptidase family protein [Acidimicrobiia bacterium]
MTRLSRVLVPVSALVLLLALPAAAAPFAYRAPEFRTFPGLGPPEVTAPSWILYDESIDMVLAAEGESDARAIASTTKIMTGLLVIENAGFNEVVTVSQEAADTGGQEIGLLAGEQMTVGSLFKALMVRSANDAATALAEHISGSVDQFVQLMNNRADELGLESTSFANPHGMDAPGHYSTAQDLLTIARLAMGHPEFADAVRSRAMVMNPAPDGTQRVGISTNLMLTSYEGTMGVKTGLTPRALFTFVGVAEREGRRLYAVVLGSPENFGHFADAKALFDYGFRDLGFYGDALTESPYTAAKARVDPEPMVTMGRVETYLHLAAQGLMLDQPSPLGGTPQPEPPPIIEVTRRPHGAETSVSEAFLYWIERAFGA